MKFILDAWKSIQTNRSLSFLVQLFNDRLTANVFATELRVRVKDSFEVSTEGRKYNMFNTLLSLFDNRYDTVLSPGIMMFLIDMIRFQFTSFL